MKSFIHNISSFVWSVILIILIFFALVLILLEVTYDDYYKGAEWDCEPENFRETYSEMIDNKITELQIKYNIECEKYINPDYDTVIEYYMYDDTFTIHLVFGARLNSTYAKYKANLYYYGNDKSDLDDYAKQKNLVDFLSEITHYFGYDTGAPENKFEQFYNSCIDNEKMNEFQLIHDDDLIGDVSYSVILKSDHFSYYYRAEKNSEIETLANVYQFEGLMKGNPS